MQSQVEKLMIAAARYRRSTRHHESSVSNKLELNVDERVLFWGRNARTFIAREEVNA